MCSIIIISILSTRIDKTVLLIFCFWFSAPVRCLVFPRLFFLVALFFGFVHGLGVVFGRGIDCIEDLWVVVSVLRLCSSSRIGRRRKKRNYQWRRASIDELMLSTSRHNHEISSFDILVFTSNSGFAYSRGESQGLVDGVNLGKIPRQSLD